MTVRVRRGQYSERNKAREVYSLAVQLLPPYNTLLDLKGSSQRASLGLTGTKGGIDVTNRCTYST